MQFRNEIIDFFLRIAVSLLSITVYPPSFSASLFLRLFPQVDDSPSRSKLRSSAAHDARV